MRIFRIISEIRNYFYLLKVIRKNKLTPEWSKLNLRTNWFGSIATVINLPPDVFKGESIYYQMYVIEQMKPINRYLESLNLQEIIYPRTESLVDPKEGVYSYLVKYNPLFRDFTFWWVVSRLGMLSVVIWVQARFDLIGLVYQFGSYIASFITGR